MTKIVGLTGKAGAGKNEVIDQYLQHCDHPRYSILAFGDGVKHAAAAVFKEPLGKFYTSKHELSGQWGITYRDMLQKLGTDFAREMINEDFWIKVLDGKLVMTPDTIDLVFIPDVRFDNEAEYIKRQGGVVIELTRPDEENSLSTVERGHKSEDGINSIYIDAGIVNRSSLKELGTQMEKVLIELGFIH